MAFPKQKRTFVDDIRINVTKFDILNHDGFLIGRGCGSAKSLLWLLIICFHILILSTSEANYAYKVW